MGLDRPPCTALTAREESEGNAEATNRPGAGPSGSVPPRVDQFLARLGLIATAGFSFSAGMKVYQGAGVWPPSVAVGLGLYVCALLCLVSAFVLADPRSRRSQGLIATVIVAALISLVAYDIAFGGREYGTDAIAFAHAGAELLLDGSNPYSAPSDTVSVTVDRFGVPETFITRTSNGQVIDQLISYPAGHVIAYTGALALGVDELRWATLFFEVAALAVIWLALSTTARFVVPIVLLVEPNLVVSFTTGGLTDWLWVLPLAVCAVFLHRMQFTYAGLALGIACAVKQQPWFAVPFVVAWVVMQTQGSEADLRRSARLGLVGGLIGGFAALNLPFFIWSPPDWMSGVLSPLLSDLVPDGQGPSLLASRGFLPVSPTAFTVTMAVALGLALILYVKWFVRLQDALWILPPIVLFLSYRSFHSYMIYWLPIAVLWLDLRSNQVERETETRRLTRQSRWWVGSAALALLTVAGLSIGNALNRDDIRIASVDPSIEHGVVTAMNVEITNPGIHAVIPVFEVYWGGWPVPWLVEGDPKLNPGQTRSLRIVPADPDSIPPSRLTAEGLRRILPFRVRVNEEGERRYGVSALVRPTPTADSIVNPAFALWNEAGDLNRHPFGWSLGRQAPLASEANVAPIGSGRGVVGQIRNQATPGQEWAEVSLLQDVGSLGGCYELTLNTSDLYSLDAFGSPTRALGLQVAQAGKSMWFVPSDITDIRATTLTDGTRVIEFPAEEDVLETFVLDLRVHADQLGIRLGARASVKIFNALHQSQDGPQEIRVSEFREANCGRYGYEPPGWLLD